MAGRSVLITGCSSGIGLCAAQTLRARGWRVFATARKPEDISHLKDEIGVESLYLDYAEPQSIAAAVEHVLSATTGTLTALFNNGGYGQLARSRTSGPMCCGRSSKSMYSAGTI